MGLAPTLVVLQPSGALSFPFWTLTVVDSPLTWCGPQMQTPEDIRIHSTATAWIILLPFKVELFSLNAMSSVIPWPNPLLQCLLQDDLISRYSPQLQTNSKASATVEPPSLNLYTIP